MRNATPAFMRALADDRRNYTLRAVITLADNTVLNLDNEDIWEDGLKFDDAVSADNLFQVGGAIINQATLVINNIYDTYSEYDFTGAHIVIYVGLNDLDDDTDEELRICTVEVDEAEYNGAIITLKCLDYMARFDRVYDTNLNYQASLDTIVRDACTKCGVTLATSSLNFPHNDYVVTNKPSGENTTYRQVISWAAQIAGCFARCNADGELEIRWYNTAAINDEVGSLDGGIFDDGSPTYESGDSADGGSFYPWDTGDVSDGGSFTDFPDIHQIASSYSCNISTDDVVITGIRVIKKVQVEGSSDAFVEYTAGTSGYVVIVENNDFIDGTHGQDVATWLGTALIGTSFRKADITHPSDPTIEAGDVGFFYDYKGNKYPIIISSTSFSCNNSQHTTSSAETPAKNSQTRFTETTRNYVDLRKRQARDFSELSQRISEAGGLYETDVTVSGAVQKWYHDKPDLEDSQIVMVFSDVGFTLTSDYQTPAAQGGPTWYGMTVDGQMIASILNTTGINADWINTGQIVVKDANDNVTFMADCDTGDVTIKATDVPHQYYGTGAPSSSTYPESSWTTDVLKNFHVGDLYTDTQAHKTYKYTYGYYGSTIKFSEDCETESVSYDYVRIFFEYNGTTYAYEKVGGRAANTNTIAGAEFFIPASQYYIYWYTDTSSHNFYGWKVESSVASGSASFPSTASATSLPTGTTAVTATTPTPESDHNPYSDNLRELWTVSTGRSGGYGYYWEEITADLDPQEVIDEMTQQQVFDKLTNYGQAQGIYLQNGQLYILFTYAKGGTLTLGGASNANGVLIMQNGNGTQVGRWDKDGLSVSENISLSTTYGTKTYKIEIADGVQRYYQNNTLVSSFYTVQGSGTDPFYITYKDTLTLQPISGSGAAISMGYGSVAVSGNFGVSGTKNRIVEDTRYGDRLLYAYETATPYFGDIGIGKTDETGEAIIDIDDIFDATVNIGVEYCVFLQKEGPGDIWVSEKESTYFVVSGTPSTKFSWEIKSVQKGFEDLRLDDNALVTNAYVNDDDIGLSMESDLAALDNEELFDEVA